MPVTETEFVGYRLDSAIGAKIGFKMDDKGAVIGLTLPGNNDFIALKEKL